MLITFEGIDGCGKSTQAKNLYSHFSNMGRDVILESDPSWNTTGGIELRNLVLKTRGLTPRTQHLLFSAARAQLIEERIKPALDRGAIVICDRFEDSSLIYQTGGKYHGDYHAVNYFANPDGLEPDITFFITLNPVAAMNRIMDPHRVNNVFDNVTWEVMAARHEAYNALYDRLRKVSNRKIHKINGLQDTHLVKYDILEVIKSYGI